MGPDLKKLVTAPIGMEVLDEVDACARGDHPVCGDRLAFGLIEEAGRIGRLAFQATACPACLAVASCAVQVYQGRRLPEGPPFEELRREISRLGGLSNFEGHALKLVEQVLEAVFEKLRGSGDLRTNTPERSS